MFLSETVLYLPLQLTELVVWVEKHCKDRTGVLLGIVASVLDGLSWSSVESHVEDPARGKSEQVSTD